MEYYSVKKRNNAIRTNMVEPRDYHTKWSKSDRKRQIPYHLYVEPKNMIQMNLFTKQKRLPDMENKHMVTKGEGGGGMC